MDFRRFWLSGNRRQVICPKSELVQISDVHCTVTTQQQGKCFYLYLAHKQTWASPGTGAATVGACPLLLDFSFVIFRCFFGFWVSFYMFWVLLRYSILDISGNYYHKTNIFLKQHFLAVLNALVLGTLAPCIHYS